ncbi:MAG TPA: VCBS repeat-containing protein, partial [Pyrinomonadaceae bacterium]|nr:VCBS repeat-containing protein [Pyrinomonadaceae bacterium]
MKLETTTQFIKRSWLGLFVCALSVAAGAQTISLQLQSDYTIGNPIQTPSFLAVGDINNDGKPDLVTLNKGTTTAQPISVFLNNGSGGFNAPITLSSTVGPNSVALG